MTDTPANFLADRHEARKRLVPAALLVLLVTLVSFLAYRGYAQSQSGSLWSGRVQISPSALEQQAGLRVTLVAVTAAGGMVDFRFKVVDAEKAVKTLQDGKILPHLTVAGTPTSLQPAPETLQDLKLENGQVYYILYSNTGNLVKPGTPVSVLIDDWQLEPIVAK
jgi:hypothetical protein